MVEPNRKPIDKFKRAISPVIDVLSGKWSAEMPRCKIIECPPIDAIGDKRLQLLEYNNTFGGRAVFACMWGHRLLGSHDMECRGDGSWSGGMPGCVGRDRESSILCSPQTGNAIPCFQTSSVLPRRYQRAVVSWNNQIVTIQRESNMKRARTK